MAPVTLLLTTTSCGLTVAVVTLTVLVTVSMTALSALVVRVRLGVVGPLVPVTTVGTGGLLRGYRCAVVLLSVVALR